MNQSISNKIIGRGEMADLIRQLDWSATPLGAIDSWSPEFLAVLNMAISTPIPGFIYWGPALTVFYNDAARPITSDKHPHSLGQAAKDVWKEAWHILGPEVEHVLSTGESFHHQQTLVPLAINGKLENLYWDYTFSPVFQQSRVAGVLVICQDVTKAVAADRKLRDAEALSKRILQSIGDAVIVTDSKGHITRMNPVAEQLTGWPLSEARDQPLASVFRIINETTRETVESPADKVIRLRTIVGLANHTILIGKNGTETPIDDSGAPILSDAGELTGTVLVFRDVSERRAAEQERENLALRMQQILEASSDGVAIVNRDWRFTYLNQQGRQILNFTQDPSGQNIWEAFPAMIFPDSPYVLHYHRAMEQGIAGDFLTTYPEPLNISVHILVRPFADGIIIFFHDVTEQVRRDAVLMQNEKLAVVGRMASSIAHEINNPLEAVTNLLYIARSVTDLSEAVTYLDTADHELRRVANIVNQTLRFHRQATRPQEVSCSDLFSTVLDLYASRLRNASVSVEKRKRADKPVEIYEGDIRQVLNNLVGNAIDAMPNGGRLLVRSCEATDWCTGRKGLRLTLADTGTGMSTETRKRIFEAFFTTKGIGGSGLGLWVSAEIVERHAGRLRIRSSQRKGRSGTVAALFLPFEPPSSRTNA